MLRRSEMRVTAVALSVVSVPHMTVCIVPATIYAVAAWPPCLFCLPCGGWCFGICSATRRPMLATIQSTDLLYVYVDIHLRVDIDVDIDAQIKFEVDCMVRVGRHGGGHFGRCRRKCEEHGQKDKDVMRRGNARHGALCAFTTGREGHSGEVESGLKLGNLFLDRLHNGCRCVILIIVLVLTVRAALQMCRGLRVVR